jgi:hypothetical protein
MGVRNPLGILLFKMGLISYGNYMRTLSKHLVLPIITLEDCRIPPSLMQEIRKSIPLHKEITFYLAHPLEIESAHKAMFDSFYRNRDH